MKIPIQFEIDFDSEALKRRIAENAERQVIKTITDSVKENSLGWTAMEDLARGMWPIGCMSGWVNCWQPTATRSSPRQARNWPTACTGARTYEKRRERLQRRFADENA